MIVHSRCIKAFVGDAFGDGFNERYEEGRVYALPSVFVANHATFFKAESTTETKPLRQALEIKSNNGTRKRTRKSSGTKTKSQNN